MASGYSRGRLFFSPTLQVFFRPARYNGPVMHGRILIVEDEAPLAKMVALGLQKDGYTVETAPDGITGLQMALDHPYDLILLDLMLPGLDGWGVCRRLRDRRSPVPILMLTARDEVEDRVKGLETGADDYLPKPFAFAELRARIAALLRRERLQRRRVLQVADLRIDTQAKQVSRDGQPVSLTPKEYELLEILAGREGQVVERDALMARLWPEADTVSNSLEVHVAALRRKIESGRDARLIHTVHRRGYVLRTPVGDDGA